MSCGDVVVSKNEAILNAVMGYSVVVTLYNKIKGAGGMCHFDIPKAKNAALTTRHGNGAILELARKMKKIGSKRHQLEAQIIGGSKRNDGSQSHGKGSVKIAENLLKKFQVPVVSKDVGGIMGRKMMFNTLTGESIVVKTHRLRSSDWLTDGH
ncbi:MAG: chemotaxis protein CheD [Planctomycetes bacterium]|nr:chemotaxis protein CheD [Planctomycetota bacterium]